MAGKEGLQLGPYRLLQLLGTGRFSEVYLGEHTHLGNQVALKLLPLDQHREPRLSFWRKHACHRFDSRSYGR